VSIPSYLSAAVDGRYVIEREIGRGGMATVYVARDLRHDRAVALKLLNPELGAVLGIDRFLAEIRVTANLQHPNLLPLFDSGEANGQPFYVMPYVEGESLRHRIDREKQLPVDEAIRIAVAVAGALEYAHAHGVIHRDLKPENILLQSGQPVVADFGIALAVSRAGGARITQTGISLGTPQYMSPEQATGDRVIDGRSDIYSLGAVTYEMLTGDPPHTGSTMQAVMARVLTERPRALRSVRPSVPEHAAIAVERALEKLPADRWASARDFADALQGRIAFPLRSDATSAISKDARALPPAFVRARGPLALGALLIGVAGVAFGVWAWRHAPSIDSGRTVRFTIAPAAAGQDIPPPTHIAISPDGRLIAYVVRGESQQRLALRDLSQLTTRVIPGTEHIVTPLFSPDGAWIAFLPAGARLLQKVAVTGGPVLTIGETTTLQGASWARPDLIVASVRESLMTIPAAGGKFQPIPRSGRVVPGELGQRSPHALDDGETVLYQSWRGSPAVSKIGVISLTTGKIDILDILGTTPIGVVDGFLIYGTSAGAIMGVPFDVRRRRITGTAVALIEAEGNVNNAVGGLVRAAVARSGSLVYMSGGGNSQIVLADMQGRVRVLVAEPRLYGAPRFSPDGKRLAVDISSSSTRDVWIYDIASATLTRLTSDGERNLRAEWSPDGKRILYVSDRGGSLSLWWQNADLSGAPELVERAPGPVNGGAMTRDGQTLAYWLSTPIHPIDILYRHLTGDTTSKPIAATSAAEVAPKFSADGKWIAYVSNQDGGPQVYVQPFPPTGAHFQVTATGGMEPVWSPDGSRIFYVWNGRLSAATIQRSPTFAVTARVPILEGFLLSNPPNAMYDVSPDGKSLVLLRPTGPNDQIVVVHDWKYELRQRMSGKREK